ncbi:unnamed protein product (macronuclear) [Paramecium tetraurelia]|uniref:Uncharacterized protein n=1 Tax=Paramecium tetraurelia TaxID=5888 RepID=A0E0K4_PARTE|nr:uncharacterized protein GSPATT00021989001 [Paramecium tetraurelia]CAK88821.1 unnamed protein product [Paramecium tetraurelia]|eukprot:XP_001456218.1 hypothetical protein (macronuclear) [Paramecium tetraurelia strain d4-2]
MLISSILGWSSLFLITNYSLYKYYFTQPLKALTLAQIIKRDLWKWRFQKWKSSINRSPYQIELKFGLNHKPISGNYVQQNIQTIGETHALFINNQNNYQHLTNMNVKQINDFQVGMNQLFYYNFHSDYILLSICHKLDDENNTYNILVQSKKFTRKEEEGNLKELAGEYVYFILKQDSKVRICQNFGNKTMDIDFIDRIIQHTIKNEKVIEYIDLDGTWFNENSQYCKCVLKLDEQYNLININKINNFEIIESQKMYDKIIDNLKNKTILYIN